MECNGDQQHAAQKSSVQCGSKRRRVPTLRERKAKLLCVEVPACPRQDEHISSGVSSPCTPNFPSRSRPVILTPGAAGPSRSHLKIVCSSTYEDYDQELYMKEADSTLRVLPDYIMRQVDITAPMRSVVVDWMSEVCQVFGLCSDTLFLAASCFDRFLSRQPAKPRDLQLVGVTSLWIAAKYEEITCPTLRMFRDITNNTYTQEQMLSMERKILCALNYQLTVPTAKTFLRLHVCDNIPNVHIYLVASYLLELSLLDHTCLRFLPSQLAAGAVFWASVVVGEPLGKAMLSHMGEHASMMACAKHLALLHLASFEGGKSSVKHKYSQAACFKVAAIPPKGLSELRGAACMAQAMTRPCMAQAVRDGERAAPLAALPPNKGLSEGKGGACMVQAMTQPCMAQAARDEASAAPVAALPPRKVLSELQEAAC